MVAALTDDLEGPDGPDALVIDDFHLTGAAGAEALALLVEHLPPSLQLVLATRVDPNFGSIGCVRTDNWSSCETVTCPFRPEETKRFLASFDVELDEPDVDLVHDRSEGWAAGLQMAAISIAGSPDPVKAARHVSSHRHTVAGYFLDEVLYRQPPEVVDFMLATSVLDELSVDATTALVQDRRSQHEVNDFGRLAVEDLVQEIPGHRVAVELYAAGRFHRVGGARDRNGCHLEAGYFLDEVLYRQPPEVVDFMLATSVLDERGGGVHRQLVQDRRSQHEVNDFGRLAVEDLVQEIPGHRVAVELYAAGRFHGSGEPAIEMAAIWRPAA